LNAFQDELVAPPLLFSEVASSLHRDMLRKTIGRELAERSLAVLQDGTISQVDHPDVRDLAWRIADKLSWTKTYDAEYLALATILDCEIATVDQRLERAARIVGVRIWQP
jgi:predicted nucleic acid-binding protein